MEVLCHVATNSPVLGLYENPLWSRFIFELASPIACLGDRPLGSLKYSRVFVILLDKDRRFRRLYIITPCIDTPQCVQVLHSY